MQQYAAFLKIGIAGNTVSQWLVFAALVGAGAMALRILKGTVLKYLEKLAARTETDLDDLLLDLFERRGYLYLYYLVFLAASKYLVLPALAVKSIAVLGKVLLAFILISSAATVLRRLLEGRLSKAGGQHKELSGLFTLMNFIVWSIGLLLLLDNLGIKVSTLLAGMGIGGVAVALAAQAILGDLFSYFSILFDKPFEIGDFIETSGGYSGTVEHIGIKTTRLRSISGELIVFSNSDLVSSRPRNYKHMSRRRVAFKIGVTCSTPKAALEKLPGAIKAIVAAQQGVAFDRAHFAAVGQSSFDFEVVYYVESPDYGKYMDIQQAINLRLVEEFCKLGVEFAFPTRTVYVKNA